LTEIKPKLDTTEFSLTSTSGCI